MARIDGEISVVVENTSNWQERSTITSRDRDIHLIISHDGHANDFQLRVIGEQRVGFANKRNWLARIPLSPDRLRGLVATCQKEWDEVLQAATESGIDLLNMWDFRNARDQALIFQKSQMLALALAGRDLFRAIFLPTGGSEKLRAIGKRLCELPAHRPLSIAVSSDSFFIPWNLLYTLDIQEENEGRDFRPDGFLGYSHMIEHLQEGHDFTRPDQDELPVDTELRFALHLDESIDSDFEVPCNSVIRGFLTQYPSTALNRLKERNTSVELRDALKRPELDEHVLYFCCHALDEVRPMETRSRLLPSPYLRLSDNVAITPDHIERWLDDRKFEKLPIVFLNACYSGQLYALNYDNFGTVFLRRQVGAVIGATASIPAVFAGQFAAEFFKELFLGGQDPDTGEIRSVGYVLHKIRRKFWDTYYNPLGLLYSLFHGADMYLSTTIRNHVDVEKEDQYPRHSSAIP